MPELIYCYAKKEVNQYNGPKEWAYYICLIHQQWKINLWNCSYAIIPQILQSSITLRAVWYNCLKTYLNIVCKAWGLDKATQIVYHRNPHIVSSKSNQYSTICYKVEYWFDFELLMSGCYISRHVIPEVVIFSWPHNWKLIIKTNCFIFSYQNLLIWAQKYIIYLFKSYLIGLVVWATIYYIFVFNFRARI